MIELILSICIASCLATAPVDTLRPIPPGARHVADEDSLGYDEFRRLSPDDQRRSRARAREWLGVSRDALRVSEGRRPSLPWRFWHRPTTDEEYTEFLRRSLDYAATAVGCCPYEASAWIQYADVGLKLERDDIALACVGHARKANAYERDPEVREANRVQIQRIEAFASFNMKEYVAALDAAKAILRRSPRAWPVRLIAARSALRLGHYVDARSWSESVPESSEEYALSRGVLGAAELGLGNLDAARRAFEEAAESGLVAPDFENDRGRLELASDRPQEAVGYFSTALDLQPLFWEAACNLSVAYRLSGDVDSAVGVLLTQLDRDPGNGPVHLALAETYREVAASSTGDVRRESALLALEHGASADEVVERRASLITYLDGVESVEEYIQGLIAEQKASAYLLAVLARVKQREGRLDIAEGLLRMATLREDASARVFAEYGAVLLRRGNSTEAREALTTACTMDRSLVVSRINLSVACELLGDMPAAWAALDEAIELDPLHPLVLQRVETAGHL